MKCTKADFWFSRFIRIRDADENGIGTCITCGLRKDVKYMDNSHFIGRQHQATRFDEMNCHVACKKCNGFEEGKKDVYEKYLIDRYGPDRVILLKLRGKSTCKRTQLDLDYIAIYFKKKATELAKEKNIPLW